jgi:DNA repair exonuclease SbcCD ATPase subunit
MPTGVIKTDPDPTEAVKEALTLAIKNLDDKLSQRMDFSDKAVTLARDEVKTATDQLAKAYDERIAAALKTASESQNKMADAFDREGKSTNEKIDRLTSRMDRDHGRDTGIDRSRQDHATDKSQMIAMLMAAAAVGGFMVSLLQHWK